MYKHKKIEHIIKDVLFSEFGVPFNDIYAHSKIVEDLGLDSLDTMELIMALEEEFETEISDEEASKLRTIEDIVQWINTNVLVINNVSILNTSGTVIQNHSGSGDNIATIKVGAGWPIENNIIKSITSLEGKVIILNAPPAAGKDTVANALCTLTGATHSRFKHHLYLCTASLFKMPLERFMGLAEDTIDKEVPHKELVLSNANYTKLCEHTKKNRAFTVDKEFNVHISPREALIFTSEVAIKPVMGNAYFGEAAASYITTSKGNVFSDGGFQEELAPIIGSVGAENVYVVQFTREGSESFDGDSRDWLDVSEVLPESNLLITTNNDTVDKITKEILYWVLK